MNSQNSSAKPQGTVPAEYVPPMSLHRFCEITGLSKASAWRYEKRGWLRTHLIANKRYVLAADIAEFNRRLASDDDTHVADLKLRFLRFQHFALFIKSRTVYLGKSLEFVNFCAFSNGE